MGRCGYYGGMFGKPVFLFIILIFTAAAYGAGAAPSWQMLLLEDPDGRWAIEDVSGGSPAAQFEPVAAENLNIGFTSSAWWVRLAFDLPPEGRYLLEIDYTQNDRLTFFLPDGQGWRRIEAGDTYPMSTRPFLNSVPVFPLPEGYSGDVFVRVASLGAVMLPLQVWEQETFLEHTVRSQFGYGLYYAFLLAMAIYNLFLYASVRDTAYLWYVLYLGGLLLFQGTYTGHASLWLWPDSPAWTNHATVTGVALMLAAGMQFVIAMAQTRRYSPHWHRLLQVFTGLALLLPVLLIVDFRMGTIAATALGAVILALLPVPVALNYLRGCRAARFVLLGILAFFPGAALFILRLLDVLPSTWLTEHALQTGTAVEVMLLSFALADRINLLNREKDQAQRALLDAQDDERRRIAQDLHDGLGQNLLLLANRIKRIKAKNGNTGELETTAGDSLQELRRVARNLYPNALDRLGLKPAIESMLEQTLIPAGIEVRCEMEDVTLTQHNALQVFRIAQEAINNVLRHARASSVSVQMETVDGSLRLQISDNGIGLSPQPGTGLGLSGMRERAKRIGGSLSINRRPSGGTEIRMEAPLRHASARENPHG